VSYNATTFYDRGRTLQGVFASARDVTERKQRELDALSLANEISHRIKNNLQVIVGLISYEAKWTAAPCVQGYKTMQARIGAIKHAFPHGSGRIKLGVERAGDQIDLVISDDGIGIKNKNAAKSPEKRSSDYVAIFARQLGGAVVPTKQGPTGTTVRIRLPLLLVPSGGTEPLAA